ncbi:unnamed protein product [Fusarium fujikuroi]|nr:unnamed protein product [Fusarium fujikuroi]
MAASKSTSKFTPNDPLRHHSPSYQRFPAILERADSDMPPLGYSHGLQHALLYKLGICPRSLLAPRQTQPLKIGLPQLVVGRVRRASGVLFLGLSVRLWPHRNKDLVAKGRRKGGEVE